MVRKGAWFYFKNFLGKRNGVDFHLYISENHPALTNIGSHLKKTENKRFYLITGFAEPKLSKRGHYKSYVEKNDKITITPFNP